MATRSMAAGAIRRSAGGALVALLTALALFAAPALAQPSAGGLTIGVITTKEPSGPGGAHWLLAQAWEAELNATGGIFGVPINLALLDDGGSPERAATLAQQLAEGGALALLCCSTPGASRAVARVAEEAGVPLLAPTDLAAPTSNPYWAFSLRADGTDEIAAIVADAYRENRHSLALMAPEGRLGDAGLSDLDAHLKVVGRDVQHVERYPVGARELRPEALLIAASQPGGVVVWGFADDLVVATGALRRRGFDGNVYGRAALVAPGEERPGQARLPWARLLGVRFAVAPAVVAEPSALTSASEAPTIPTTGTGGARGACAAAGAADAARLARVPGGKERAISTAPLLAALDLLELALEQLLALQIPSDDPRVLRQALRDSLVGLPPTCTGAGLIKLRDGNLNAVEPNGLAIGVVTPAGLAPLD